LLECIIQSILFNADDWIFKFCEAVGYQRVIDYGNIFSERLLCEEVDEIKGWVKGYEKRDDLIAAFKKHYKIMAPRIADRIQFPEHKEFIAKYSAENPE
jgi:hypothetical protein